MSAAETDLCGQCGVPWIDHTKAPSDNHPFVEPAAPVPQGESDAAVRAIAARWYANCAVTVLERVEGAVRDAFAAGRALGRADGAREEREAFLGVLAIARRGKQP